MPNTGKFAGIKQKTDGFSKEKLQKILLEIVEMLSEEQYAAFENLLEAQDDGKGNETVQAEARMSREYTEEKMKLLEGYMAEIDEGDLWLDTEEYEDYSSGYWDSDWIIEYYDNQGIGEKIAEIIRFANDCVNDRKYVEANALYEWLWEMDVSVDSEYGDEYDTVGLEVLAENEIIRTDMEKLALLTLYAAYQTQDPDQRAEGIYRYFSFSVFRRLRIEDMFRVGREELEEKEQFWKDWIALLKAKSGEMEARLLKEAVLWQGGTKELIEMADEDCAVHPSLYLFAMEELLKRHDYAQVEKLGARALENLEEGLIIRSKIALRAAYASSCLSHMDNVMRFCWEGFCSDPSERNFLRLFGSEEMAKQYGMQGHDVLRARKKRNFGGDERNLELRQSTVGDTQRLTLSFYFGEFAKVQKASKNPSGSLGWSGNFIWYGIRLFLLYLYENPLPSQAAADIAGDIEFQEEKGSEYALAFETEIQGESDKNHTSLFWSYFQRWKRFFPMTREERENYLSWAEKIVYDRADAIVGGQHRRHYGKAAAMLSMVAEIKESMGNLGAKQEVFQAYKKKFPRHSAFQSEMKSYFGMWK